MLVVGVAKDSKYESVREIAKPFFYVPLRQNFSRGVGLYIRTPLSPQTMATALAHEVHAMDPNLALYEVIRYKSSWIARHPRNWWRSLWLAFWAPWRCCSRPSVCTA